jgi:glycosyltransferase involved in cell wall biosynthesis
MPKVSVIIPAYNPGSYLDEAIQSVVAQTFTDWECIVVDDGSTENLSRIEKMDPRIRLIRQPNRGVSAARNNAILNSTGEYIAFLDADDLYLPTKLEKQVKLMILDPRIGYCHTSFRLIDAAGVDIGPGYKCFAAETHTEMLEHGGFLCGTSIVTRRAIASAGLFDPLLRSGEDYDFALRVARFFRVAHISEYLYLYRQLRMSASSDHARMWASLRNVHERFLLSAEFSGDRHLADSVKHAVLRQRHLAGVIYYDAARRAVNDSRPFSAAIAILQATIYAPGYTLRSLVKYTFQKFRRTAKSRCGMP